MPQADQTKVETLRDLENRYRYRWQHLNVAANWLHSCDEMSRQVQLYIAGVTVNIPMLSGLSLLPRRIGASLCMPKLTLETWLGSICTCQAMSMVDMRLSAWKPRSRFTWRPCVPPFVFFRFTYLQKKVGGNRFVVYQETMRHIKISEHFNLAADQRQQE